MIGRHHQLDGHEFEQTWEDSEGQGSLVCCSPWGRKELDTTKGLNNNKYHNDSNSLETLIMEKARNQWKSA